MPWKNGGGSTIEIVRDPELDQTATSGVPLSSEFNFRLSIATITASGPFSSFPGVDRTIIALGGAAVSLTHRKDSVGPEERIDLQPLVPHGFSGEMETHGTISGEAARDFNVMIARDFGRAAVATMRCTSTTTINARSTASVIYVFCVHGPVDVTVSGVSGPVTLDEDDTLEINPWDPGEEITIEGRSDRDDAAVFLVEIFPHQRYARRRSNPWASRPRTAEGRVVATPPESRSDAEPPRPEDFVPTPPRPLTRFQIWPSPGSALWAAALMLAMTLVSAWHWRLRGDSGLWASGESVLSRGEIHRLFTALFVHGDLSHLLNNAPIFLFFGYVLRAYFGRVAFPLLALLIGVLSNLVTIAIYDPTTRVIGASGMIYGMVAMWLTLYLYFDRQSPFAHRVMRTVGFSIMVMFPSTYEKTTSYLAHGAGFLIGIIIGLAALPFFKKNKAINTIASETQTHGNIPGRLPEN